MKKLLPLLLLLSIVFALAGCHKKAEVEKPDGEAVMYDLKPQIMVDGVLYGTTGYTAVYRSDTADPAYWDGQITSEVDSSQQPTQNDQSNFGTGYGYRFGERDGTVEVLMDKKWVIFATDQARVELRQEHRGQ